MKDLYELGYTDEEIQQVQLADKIEETTDINFDTAINDYDIVAEQLGLSGNVVSDLKSVNDGLLESKNRETELVLKGMYRLGYQPKLGSSDNPFVNSAVGNFVKSIPSGVSQLGYDTLGTLGTVANELFAASLKEGVFNSGMPGGQFNKTEVPQEFKDKVDETRKVIQRSLDDITFDMSEYSDEAYNVEGNRISSDLGRVIGQLPYTAVTAGVTAVPLAVSEMIRDAEQTTGVNYEDMEGNDRAKVMAAAGAYSMFSLGVERFGLKAMGLTNLNRFFNGSEKITGKAFQKIVKGSLSEGGTEFTQAASQDQFAKVFDPDREVGWEDVKGYFYEAAIGSIVGGGVTTLTTGAEAYTDRSDKRKFLSLVSDQEINRLQDTYSEEDLKTKADKEFGERKTDNGELLVDLLVKARRGDKDAYGRFFEATAVDRQSVEKKQQTRNKLIELYDPVKGMKDQDIALSKNVFSDEEFYDFAFDMFGNERTEDNELLVDLATKTREGDKEARERLRKATTINVANEAAIIRDPELTEGREEYIKAKGEEQVNALEQRQTSDEFTDRTSKNSKNDVSVKFAVEDLYNENLSNEDIIAAFEQEVSDSQQDENGEPTVINKISTRSKSRLKNLATEEEVIAELKLQAAKMLPDIEIRDHRNDPKHVTGKDSRKGRTMTQEIDEMFGKDYESAKEFELSVKQAYAADTGIDINDVSTDDIIVNGSARLERSDINSEGLIRLKGVASIYSTGDTQTLIEEISESKIQLDLAKNNITERQIDGWIKKIQSKTDDEVINNLDVKSASVDAKIEWLSSRAVEWWSTKNENNSKGLPKTLIDFLNRLADYLTSIVNRGNILREMNKKGVLPQDFKDTIDLLYNSDTEPQNGEDGNSGNFDNNNRMTYSLSLSNSANQNRSLLSAEKAYYNTVQRIKESMVQQGRNRMTTEERQEVEIRRQRAASAKQNQKTIDNYETKIANLALKRVTDLIKKDTDALNVTATIQELENIIRELPTELRGRFRGFATAAKQRTPEAREAFLERARRRVQSISEKANYYKKRKEIRNRYLLWQKKIKKAKGKSKKLTVTYKYGDEINELLKRFRPLTTKERDALQSEIAVLDEQINDIIIQGSNTQALLEAELKLEKAVQKLNQPSLFDYDVPLSVLLDFEFDLDSVERTGKTEWANKEKDKKAKRKQVADNIIKELGGVSDRPSLNKEKEAVLTKVMDVVAHGGRPEAITQIMFKRVQRENNTFIREILELIFDAESTFVDYYAQDIEHSTKALDGLNLDEQFHLKTGNDHVTLSANQMMAIYGYSQNDNSLNHLLATTVTTDDGGIVKMDTDFIEQVGIVLPANYKKSVDNIIDYNDDVMYERMNNVIREKLGISMSKEDRYLPITNLKRNVNAAEKDIKENNVSLNINSGMSKARVKSELPFEKLDFAQIVAKGYHESDRQIAFAIPYNEVIQRLNYIDYVYDEKGVKTKEINYTLQDQLKNRSEVGIDALNKWLARQADGRYNRGALQFLDVVRNNATISLIGGNIKSLLFIPLAGVQSGAMAKNKKAFLNQVVKRVGYKKVKENIADSKKLSTFMRNRGTNIDVNFQEMAERRSITKLQGFKDKSGIYKKSKAALHASQDFFMDLMQKTDIVVSSTVFMAQYNASIAEHGDVERAIKEAEQLVRTTQSTQSMAQSAELFASSNLLEKALRQFTGDMNMNINNWAAYASDDTKTKANRGLLILSMIIAQSMLVAIINSGWEELEEAVGLKEDRDSNDSVLKSMVVEASNQITGGLPVISDLVEGSVSKRIDHEYKMFAGDSDILALETLNKLSNITESPFVAADASLMLLGVPARKLWKPLLDKIEEEM